MVARAGFFVVLEGIDGAGKSEQVERVAAALRARGETVVVTREPTDGIFGRRYRAWARGEHEAAAEEVLELFLRDRDEHVARVIEPALARGEVVLCDRYVDSTRAYQAAAGVDRALLAARLEAHPVPSPDLTLWLRLPVTAALSRLGSSSRERFEQAAFLERVDAEYARLDLVEVAADPPRADVTRALTRRVEEALRARRRGLCDSAAPPRSS